VVVLIYKKNIKIRKFEERSNDAWIDMSLRSVREGEVRFYSVKDFLTGDWLFKVCVDVELDKVIVKAIKCPPGIRFAQLEGNTMLFQKSVTAGFLYDIISTTYVDENGRVRRKVSREIDEIPLSIRENFEVKSYEEATGKKAPGKNWATLSKEGDERAVITLFLMERAWPIASVTPDLKIKSSNILAMIKDLEKAKIEDIYSAAIEKLGISMDDVDSLLYSLERKGKVERPEAGYVKTVQ
jgi:hypothetical protein